MFRRARVTLLALVGMGVGIFAAMPAFAYGPTPQQPTITSTTTTTTPGGTITVSGVGCLAGGTVNLVLYPGGTHLATLRADSAGSYADTVTIPSTTTPGGHTMVATCDRGSADLAIAVAAAGPAPTATTSALAFTGADIFGMCLVGAGFLAGGGLLVLGARRRGHRGAS